MPPESFVEPFAGSELGADDGDAAESVPGFEASGLASDPVESLVPASVPTAFFRASDG